MTELTPLPNPAAEREVKLRVLDATPGIPSGTGSQYVTFKLQVVGTPHYLWCTVSLAPKAAWRVNQFIDGFLPKRVAQRVRDVDGIDADTLGGQFIGRVGRGRIQWLAGYRWDVREVYARA